MTHLNAAPLPEPCSHGVCLDLQGDGCHLDGPATAGQVLDRLDRRALLAAMTRESLDLGLYDTPATDYPPQEKP